MSKDLIIVESPAKVKTIKKFLGGKYHVEASVGHVRDLPSKKIGVDEANNFAPQYQVIPGKEKVVAHLAEVAAKSGTVYLAPDPDREGEAIAWHVAEIVREQNPNLKRIQFNEITAKAVKEALEHPRDLDVHLFDSQQARRVLDRLVGYKISPLLWKKVKRGISAGRVQSVALRLIVDRERARRAFQPQEYWLFKARLEGQTPPAFTTDLWKVKGKKPDISSAEQAQALEDVVLGAPFAVESVDEKERQKSPPPPFITSTLQQEANRRLSYPAKKTMGLAQKLYEGVEVGDRGLTALITYMRTDSVRIAADAQEAAKDFILERYGKDYYPGKPRVFKTKGSAQDAHEAIRPVDPSLTPDDLQSFLPRDMHRLYKLIWARFVGSQMSVAKFWDTTVTVAAAETQWRVKGERLLFPGYLTVYGRDEDEDAEVVSGILPKLAKGDALKLLKLDKEQKFTMPPARFSEASLVKELEELGIGRPSTYAAIISTLLDRDYCRMEDRQFAPTELGETVVDLLVAHFASLMDVTFTAQMEESLDKVAEGGRNWVDLMQSFAADFNPTLEKASEEMVKVKAGKETGLTCELCGKPMVIKFGKRGEFLACSGWPDCKNAKNFDRDAKGGIGVKEREPETPEVVGTCPDCGKDLYLRKARTGARFISCSGYPKCKYAKPFPTGVQCPTDGCTGELVEKSSGRGQIFYSCNRYPDCKTIVSAWPVRETCPQCGFPVMVKRHTEIRGDYHACGRKGCRFFRLIDKPAEE